MRFIYSFAWVNNNTWIVIWIYNLIHWRLLLNVSAWFPLWKHYIETLLWRGFPMERAKITRGESERFEPLKKIRTVRSLRESHCMEKYDKPERISRWTSRTLADAPSCSWHIFLKCMPDTPRSFPIGQIIELTTRRYFKQRCAFVHLFAERSARNVPNVGVPLDPGIGYEELEKESIIWLVSLVTLVHDNCRPVNNLLFWTPDCCAKPITWTWSKVTIHPPRKIVIPRTAAKVAKQNEWGLRSPKSNCRSSKLIFNWTAIRMDRIWKG